MIHESIQHIPAAGFYLCGGGGSKQLLTKEEQMRRAETTAFARAGGALALTPADSSPG